MMIIITGTPGTGKTSVTGELKKKFDAEYISINSLLDKYDLNLGVDEKLEIWSKERWEEFIANNEENLSDIADNLFSSNYYA